MFADLHAIQKICQKPPPGLSALAIVDPRDLESQPDWFIQPSISDLVFLPGKAAFALQADNLSARLLDKADTRSMSGDTFEYLLQAAVSGISHTVEYLRSKMMNRRVHLIATYQNGDKRFMPFMRITADGDSGFSSSRNGYEFRGSLRLPKPAPFFNGTFDVIGGYIPPTIPGGAGGVEVVEQIVNTPTHTYAIPAGKLLAFIWIRSDQEQMPQIGITSGGSELGGPTPLEANQGGIFGAGLLRPTSSTIIYFSGLTGTNKIELWILGS